LKSTKGFVFLACTVGRALAPGPDRDRLAIAEPVAYSSAPAADARVDIDTASLDQLMKVPGLPRT